MAAPIRPRTSGLRRRSRTSAALLVAALLASCFGPPPQPWLRYELDGATELARGDGGQFRAEVFGARVLVDLRRTDTRAFVEVDNRSGQVLRVRVGPDAGEQGGVIGELQVQGADGTRPGGTRPEPISVGQWFDLQEGWSGKFFVDEPLGGPPKLGQYFVLVLEFENADGDRARHRLPLVAKMAGTVPRSEG